MKLVCHLLRLTAFAALGITLLLLLGRFHWFLELLTHFRLPCAIAFLILTILLLISKSFKTSGLAATCLLIQLIPLSHHYLPFTKDNRPASGPALKVITFNVLTSNQNHRDVAAFLTQEDPDLICLQETSTEWLKGLSVLHQKYPHRKAHPKSNNTGLLILSKLPILQSQLFTEPDLGTPYMTATLDWQGQKLTLINAHPMPPMNPAFARKLKNTFRRIQTDTANSPHPTLVVGDFNCTAYAPSFRLLGKQLRDSSRGRGYVATWRRGHPFLAIPIDQLLHTDDLVCTQRRIGPKNGSDHSPIIATLQATKPTTGSAGLRPEFYTRNLVED